MDDAVKDLLSWRDRIREVHQLREVFHGDDGRVSEVERTVLTLVEAVRETADRLDAIEQLIAGATVDPQALSNRMRLSSQLMEAQREAAETTARVLADLSATMRGVNARVERLEAA